jgi:NAD(P)-dependent dehydrogenase (short-subunit alcohol dehydrogenase family)
MRGNQKMTSITPKVEDLLDLKWKVALVTGASAGIGRGVALRRAEAGASVAAHYRNDREAADVVVASVRDRKHRGARRPRLRRLSDAWRYLAGRDSRRPAPR